MQIRSFPLGTFVVDSIAFRLFDRRTSPASMPATVIAKEGAGLGIVGAITLGSESSGVAAFHRCIGLAGLRRGRGQRGFRRGRASVQNVRIGW